MRKGLPQIAEERVYLCLTVGVAPCAEDADRLMTGPERAAWRRVSIVKSELGRVERSCPPGQEVFPVVLHLPKPDARVRRVCRRPRCEAPPLVSRVMCRITELN